MQLSNITKLTYRTGREGPRHDPYAYEILTVERNGHTTELRIGLTCHCIFDGEKLTNDANFALFAFKLHTGMTFEQFMRYYDRIHRDDIPDPMGTLADYE